MKKLVTLIMLLALVACHKKLAKNPAPAPTEITSGEHAAIAPPNARNSLDYIGSYKGILPCADCEGLETTVELSEEFSYRMTWKYLGKGDKVYGESGKYEWNDAGDQIILTNEDGRTTPYLVGENSLSQRDTDGSAMDEAVAERFMLRKMGEADAAKSDRAEAEAGSKR